MLKEPQNASARQAGHVVLATLEYLPFVIEAGNRDYFNNFQFIQPGIIKH